MLTWIAVVGVKCNLCDSGYMFKTELTVFVAGLDMVCEKVKSQGDC